MNDLILFCFGLLAGGSALALAYRLKVGNFKTLASQILQQAEKEADNLKRLTEMKLKEHELAQSKEFETTWQHERKKLQKEEERLQAKEDKLDAKLNLIEKNAADLEKRKNLLQQNSELLNAEKLDVAAKESQLRKKLEEVSKLTASEAKDLLLKNIQTEIQAETAHFIQRARESSETNAEKEAVRLITCAINRLATNTVSEVTVTTVSLPSEELKGRIIGREGRNIRAIEKACGVNLLMDDTPQAVVISSFDPMRRHIAKLVLTDLIQDGRIHPTRIEEAVEKAENQIQMQIQQYGEDAALRAGCIHCHPEIIKLLGKLKFRNSLGQNVLDHSLEVSYLMGMMAEELNLDAALAKRIGLMHDIGKAVSHEIPGTHALIGHDLALKYGESPEVANGIGCHHQEMEPTTLEASLCSAADAISASRPGVRVDAIDEYIQRLKKLEEIAASFAGVEKAYALQAGREVRVIVLPDALNDDELVHLARNMTKRIENELKFPGKIKVTIMREKRVVDYAM